MARRATTARGGRRPTAAAPRWGHTCFVCPGRPSVLVEVAEPGEPGDQEQAWKDFAAHLEEAHGDLLNASPVPNFAQLGDVSMRSYAGPTARPAQQAA